MVDVIMNRHCSRGKKKKWLHNAQMIQFCKISLHLVKRLSWGKRAGVRMNTGNHKCPPRAMVKKKIIKNMPLHLLPAVLL